MNKLLSANLSRLRKEKLFWLEVAAILLLSVGMMLNGCRQAVGMGQSGYVIRLEAYYFNLAPVLGLFYAVFTALFLGPEYSDGTIRNKLVAGHTRVHIYAANYLISFLAGVGFLMAWLLGGLVGIPFLGTWKMSWQQILVFLLIMVFFTAAFAGIFTMISMLSTNRAITAVAELLIWLLLVVLASMVYNKLCEPEMISGIVITAEEGMQMGDPAPNPEYVSGAARTALEWLLDFLPTGQGILMANLENAHPVREMISSAVIAVSTTLGGMLVFRKKDLK